MSSDELIYLGDDHAGLADNWELEILAAIPDLERNLITMARLILRIVVRELEAYRRMDDGPPAVNLGIVVRVRDDMLGPRIHWVKFRGSSRFRTGGEKFTPTDPIKMQGRYRYSSRIFAGFPERTREALVEHEARFAWIRFRTERLAALRDFCRKTKSLTP
jgi:hypothetical protein